MQHKRTIHITINGYTVTLKINPEEEELYRRAGKAVNQSLDELMNKCSTADFAHVAIMAALNFAVIAEKITFQQDIKPMADKMAELLGKIDNTLQDSE